MKKAGSEREERGGDNVSRSLRSLAVNTRQATAISEYLLSFYSEMQYFSGL